MRTLLPKVPSREPRTLFRTLLLPSAAAISLTIILLLGRVVVDDLRQLRSAQSDTVQWTLSQVEIEYLDFNLSLQAALVSEPPDLALVRKDFDVFFSRYDIIANGVVFAEVRQNTAFDQALTDIKAFLQNSMVAIDAEDAALTASLHVLAEQTTELRPAVRNLYVTGLAHFVDASDQLRARLSATLWELSAVTALLIVSLLVLTAYSRATGAVSHARGRELARANAHMQTILSTSLDAVIVSDDQGIVLDFNAAASAIFGYRPEEAIGRTIAELVVPPALRDAHQAGMKKMVETGEKKLVGKGRIRIEAMRKNGEIFPVELALQTGRGADGDILIAFLRDISAQVAAEQELTEARDQALAGEKAKAEFLTVMSHEIRTPLSGLLGNLSLLSSTSLTSEQQQYQGNMEISGRILLKHVNSILDIARFESGRLPIQEETFHIGELLQEIVDSQSAGAEQRNTAMSWAWIGDTLDWVKTDRGHLEQVILNFVGNAVKFTRNGRVDIELEQVGLRGSSPLVELRVIDTGIGIQEEDLELIFEEFQTKNRAGGDTGSTGLGLSIARRLATLLGGEIGVESTPGQGSVFWLRVPLPEGHEPKENEGLPQLKLTQPLHLLLVEDNEMNAFVVDKMLRAEGHSVVVASDGYEAIDWATKSDFDGILMDINMPNLDGLEATKRIRGEVRRARKTPIFAFSANVLPEDINHFRESGMDGFIGKPVQMEELRAALGTIAASPAKPNPDNATVAPSDQEARAMFGDQYDHFRARFLDEGDALSDWLKSAPDEIEEIVQRCHKIASTAALFGAHKYRQALQTAERSGKSSGEIPQDALIAIQAIWKETREAL